MESTCTEKARAKVEKSIYVQRNCYDHRSVSLRDDGLLNPSFHLPDYETRRKGTREKIEAVTKKSQAKRIEGKRKAKSK